VLRFLDEKRDPGAAWGDVVPICELVCEHICLLSGSQAQINDAVGVYVAQFGSPAIELATS
jgi:hypothetical protein